MPRTEGFEPFTDQDVQRSRAYHRPLYAAFALDAVIGMVILAVIAFTPWGRRLYRAVWVLPWWGRAAAYPALIVLVLDLVAVPVAFWRSFLRERRWGFSTQTAGEWVVDRAKSAAVGVVLTSGLLFGLAALARIFPDTWPLVAAPAAGAVVLLLSFVAPVILEPMFNRFTPLGDPALAADLRALADRAGVPIRDVLIADASRRTRKENAYVSGLGATRRVVVYDTLLSRGGPDEVELVVAHELGHRRLRHVGKGTVLGMVGSALAVAALAFLLRSNGVLHAIHVRSAADPRVVPFVLLFVAALELVALPLGSAVSRRWETEADRFSLEMTGDPAAFVRSHVDLARANLSDLDPPRWLYLATFTHPTPPERIASARRWAAVLGLRTPPPEPSPATIG